ncbi:hypothetical protein F1721_31395 [Saccharopolyspora hirsuta]|uniref:Uncharacterized protein n=1 Tax=Saccharopolyspora hirsuta TaxID=1837 RepID=A0A5M7BB29_SACHI|nr:hypothetical protein [Saccharopolyspora hirsuta]KAA5826589.1 hypothetical protein F1721_31395 [Saccharopolyspora hirsuta]
MISLFAGTNWNRVSEPTTSIKHLLISLRGNGFAGSNGGITETEASRANPTVPSFELPALQREILGIAARCGDVRSAWAFACWAERVLADTSAAAVALRIPPISPLSAVLWRA